MRCEKSLFFSVVFVCVALLATFASGQSAPKARLTIKQMVKHAPQQTSAAAPLAAPSTPGLPLWSFSVQSDRDGNQYSGVMVGSNPFNHGSGQTNVATQIVPIITVSTRTGSSRRRPATLPLTRRRPIAPVSAHGTTTRCGCFSNRRSSGPRISTMAVRMWGGHKPPMHSSAPTSGKSSIARTTT